MNTKTGDPIIQEEIERQLSLIREGTIEIVTEDDLRAKLARSLALQDGRAVVVKPLVVKLGLDPTAPDIHLGHAVVLNKLRDFQRLGHTVVFLVGDFTGRIGDPSGRSKTRPSLSPEEIRVNAETYCQQAFKILDRDRTVIDYNSRWSDTMTFADVVRLAAKYTTARMLERDDFAKRLAEGIPISLHELLYPLAQAYDSVALRADVELGGSDQKFNLMVARDIQREYGQEAEVAVLMPLLVGTDGAHKMSKSLQNYVGVNDPPEDMYGKVMSISDELMFTYYETLRYRSPQETARLREDVAAGIVHPKAAKMALARAIVETYHGAAAAAEAEAHFERVHREGLVPNDVATFKLPTPPTTPVELLVSAGLAPSRSEARRLIKQGAVNVDGRRLGEADADRPFPFAGGAVVKVGKRRFVKIVA